MSDVVLDSVLDLVLDFVLDIEYMIHTSPDRPPEIISESMHMINMK